jgi:hypothetical protein
VGKRKQPESPAEAPIMIPELPPSDTNGTLPDQVPVASANGNGEQKKPVKVFSYLVGRDSYVQASIWDRQVTLGDGAQFTTHEVTLRKRYKDAKDGEWKSASGFRGSELYAVLHAVQQANAWILETRAERNGCAPH